MIIGKIEQEIKTLSQPEKIKLMHFLIDEIGWNELDPANFFTPGDKHAVWSPYDEEKAAYQLQNLLTNHQK